NSMGNPITSTVLLSRQRSKDRIPSRRPDKLPPHSITSSARASSVGGTVTPSILAVSALMTSSNLVDCTAGRSAGRPQSVPRRRFELGGSERSLLRSYQTLVSPEQSAQGAARHRFAVAAQVFFVHCLFVRLSRFRFHRNFRPQ